MKAVVATPVKAYLDASAAELAAVRSQLTYTLSSAAMLYKRHQANYRWRNSDPDGWQEQGERLKADIKHVLLFEDDRGPWVRPGSLPYIGCEDVATEVSYAEPKLIPWAKPLPFELYDYQKRAAEELIKARHANVEICTGGGKTAIILTLAKRLGLRTVVVVPSASIFGEILKAFEHHLGKAKVGCLGDGRKVLGKQVTVCISKSLTNVKPGSAEYEFFSKADVVISDESHLNAAQTLEDVFHGLLAGAPYRFFLSGTQTRGDGADKLLQSIVGPTVYSLATADAIRGGFICDHEFVVATVSSNSQKARGGDAMAVKREHFLRNQQIAEFAARVANANAAQGLQTLILVDEVHQILRLAPLLKPGFAYAAGPGSKADLKSVGLAPMDPDDAVEAFNKGEAKVLVGTGCISTGTNIYPTHATVNWQGGASEVKTKQGAVGRSVRILAKSKYASLHKEKPKSVIYDFRVRECDVLERHLQKRLEFYADSGTKIRFLNG